MSSVNRPNKRNPRKTTHTKPDTNIKPKRSLTRLIFKWLFFSGFTLIVFLLIFSIYYGNSISDKIRAKFEGNRWDIPAQAYARPLELYVSKNITLKELLYELKLLGYVHDRLLPKSGSYSLLGNNKITIRTREFQFWDLTEPSKEITIAFNNKTIYSIIKSDGSNDYLVRLDPLAIGSFYPGKGEDRDLINVGEIPKIIPQTLITVEDKYFYSHFGINPSSIIRAALANFKAGRKVQGASTITQQLAKNFFFGKEKTYTRKIKEAITAIILELNYSKDKIIEAYLNEVFFAQNGQREIHGISMASLFYFGRPPKEINTAQVASLIALLKAPSKYNPRKRPKAALKRRNLILGMLEKDGIISPEQAKIEKSRPLGVSKRIKTESNTTQFSAFMGMVKQQLLHDYDKEDLLKKGIKVFTTFDPIVQHKAQLSINKVMPMLDRKAGFKQNTLQAAMVITKIQTGEIQAIIGGRDSATSSFNRALKSRRQIGSLIKPIIYLAALENPERYTLASILEDVPINVKYKGATWKPKNYGKYGHGKVLLSTSLAKSYNLSTARLGLDIGLGNIIRKLKDFGFTDKITPYPSLLLGAVNMSPVQVSQYYLTLSNKGFNLPLRTIKAVLSQDGKNLKSYDLTLNPVVDTKTSFLTYHAMREVVTHGTARKINKVLNSNLNIAGKTGTTNNYRDSWFAGFSGNYLTVTWIGRDKNQPTKLSGSTGALPLWIETMRRLPLTSYQFPTPQGIEFATVHTKTGKLTNKQCRYSRRLPFVSGTSPYEREPFCTGADRKRYNYLARKKEQELAKQEEYARQQLQKKQKMEQRRHERYTQRLSRQARLKRLERLRQQKIQQYKLREMRRRREEKRGLFNMIFGN